MRRVVQVSGLTIRNAQGDAVLHDISFELAEGEALALIGSSGAGKSTLGRVLLGDLTSGQRHAGGQIVCCGCEVLQATPRQLRQLRFRHTAWLGQDPAQELTPGMSVRRQLNEFHHGDANAISEMLASLGLPQDNAFLQRFPHQLSGGQRRRVALVRVLLKRPQLLILDEPFAGLDRRHREQMIAELRQLQRQYRFALLLIGHQLSAVADIAQRMLVLHKGRQLEFGDTQQLFATPKSPLLRAWLSPVTWPRPVTTQGEPLLRVSRWHPGHSLPTALPELSFALYPGQCLAVTGPSGIGKSTLARSLAGLNPPHQGVIALGDRPLASDVRRRSREQQRAIALVPQDPAHSLHPLRSVGQQLQQTLDRYRLSHPGSVDALLQLVGLPGDYARRLPRELSGGEQQRVALARALAGQPSVLICDEVTSALDVLSTRTILQLLSQLLTQGLAVLFITHDLPAARQICTAGLHLSSSDADPGAVFDKEICDDFNMRD
ncbi:TPA: ABC transporter ATP-binding protein [Salmonella enterica subsp. enterica serovar Stanley]|nr:ABC transporter ATP-binding protein [Salmonella enterica subsp. enterica serovar Stanley]